MRRAPASTLVLLVSTSLAGCGAGEGVDADWSALLKRVDELRALHRFPEALAAIEAARPARSLEPAAAVVRRREAEILLTLARPAEAARILEALVGSRPIADADPDAARDLVQAALDLGDFARALSVLEGLRGPGRPRDAVAAAKALLGLDRAGEAALAVAAGLIIDPWLDEAYVLLGRALARTGSEAAARAFLHVRREAATFHEAQDRADLAESGGDFAQARFILGQAEDERGRSFEAMVLWNQALEANAGFGPAYLALARLSIFLERPWDAVGALEKLPPDPGVTALLDEARREASRREGAPRKPLSESAPELAARARSLHAAKDAAGARRLALLAVRLAPRNPAVRLLLADVFDEAGDAFVRLWALRPFPDAPGRDRFDVEVTALGLDPGLVRRRAAALSPQ